jgi:hypothetical protein
MGIDQLGQVCACVGVGQPHCSSSHDWTVCPGLHNECYRNHRTEHTRAPDYRCPDPSPQLLSTAPPHLTLTAFAPRPTHLPTPSPAPPAPHQVCVMIHSGSRGLGHQVATDALVEMERAMARDKIATNDRQVGRGPLAPRHTRATCMHAVEHGPVHRWPRLLSPAQAARPLPPDTPPRSWRPAAHPCPCCTPPRPCPAHAPQLACARIGSREGQDYLAAMACAANYAWVNRSSMTFLTRQV